MLISGCFVLFVLAPFLFRGFFLMLIVNFSLSETALDALLFVTRIATVITMAFSVGLFGLIVYRTRLRANSLLLRRQLLRSTVVGTVVFFLIGLVVSGVVSVPLAQAELSAATGTYFLAVPPSTFDWLIGQFSSGTYYAINGSSWDDPLNVYQWIGGGESSAPWAAYKNDASAVEELCLAATSSGTIYLKEVPFDYNLTIPADVQVIENMNGLTRVFIDATETVGGPYTVAADTVNSGYYLVQDRDNRYIDTFTSGNVSYTINSLSESLTPNRLDPETITVIGDIEITAPIQTGIKTTWDLTNAYIRLAPNANCNMFESRAETPIDNNLDITILGGKFNGSRDSQTGSYSAIYINGKAPEVGVVYNHVVMKNVRVTNTSGYGVVLNATGSPYIEDLAIGTDVFGGLRLISVWDGTFIRINANYGQIGLWMSNKYCTSNNFDDCYWGGAATNVVLNGSCYNTFSNNMCFDSYYNGFVFADDALASNFGATGNLITGGQFGCNSWYSNVDYKSADVIFEGHSNNNTIANVLFSDVPTSGRPATYACDYGILERGVANHNNILSNTFKGQLTEAIVLNKIGSIQNNNVINQQLQTADIHDIGTFGAFGYTMSGTSVGAPVANEYRGTAFYAPIGTLNITSLTVHAWLVNANLKGVLAYESNQSIIAISNAVAGSAAGGSGVHTVTFADEVTIIGDGYTKYVILFISDGYWEPDATDTAYYTSYYLQGNSYSSPTDPVGWTSTLRVYTMYANYTTISY
jgi:hypothetical protein